MIKLIVDNVFIEIKGASKDCEFEIWNDLSFTIEEFGNPYPKTRHLYNRKTKKTYAGLLNHVIDILEERGEEYSIEDTRIVWEPNADYKLVEFVDEAKTIPLSFRPYQKTIVDNASERECIQAATGAGKTFMMAALAAKFNVKPLAVFADKLTLVEQLQAEFQKFLGRPIGIVGGGKRQIEDITVYSIQSATEEDVKDAKMIMIDECHHIPSNTVSEVSRWCKNAYYRIGVSATPWRDAGDDLLIDAVLAKRKPENNINASRLIELGYLVPCTIYFVPFKQQFKGKNYHKVYEDAIINNKERNESIVKIAVKMKNTKNTKTLILIQRIEHGEKLQEMLSKKIEPKAKVINVTNDNGKQFAIRVKNVEFLSGQDDAIKRKAVFQAVKEGFVDVLIGSTIADEGLDLPILDCLILAGGGKSSTRAFQRVGRVLRLAKDKQRAIVFDFEDGTPMLNRHAKVRKKLYESEPAWDIKYLNPNLLK